MNPSDILRQKLEKLDALTSEWNSLHERTVIHIAKCDSLIESLAQARDEAQGLSQLQLKMVDELKQWRDTTVQALETIEEDYSDPADWWKEQQGE